MVTVREGNFSAGCASAEVANASDAISTATKRERETTMSITPSALHDTHALNGLVQPRGENQPAADGHDALRLFRHLFRGFARDSLGALQRHDDHAVVVAQHDVARPH